MFWLAIAGASGCAASSDDPSDDEAANATDASEEALQTSASVAGCGRVTAKPPSILTYLYFSGPGQFMCPSLPKEYRYQLRVWLQSCGPGGCMSIPSTYNESYRGYGDGSPWWSDHGWDLRSKGMTLTPNAFYRTHACVRILRSGGSVKDEGGCVDSPMIMGRY